MPDLSEDRFAALRDPDPERPSMPAAEVRRRGDRLRRTRHAGSAAVALVAVVALAGGVVALTPADRRADLGPVDTPAPSVDQSPPAATIPDDVPLDVGLPAANEDGTRVQVTPSPGTDPVVACGTSIMEVEDAVDVAGVVYAGGEDHRSRTLILLDSETSARAYVDRIAEVVAECSARTVDGPASEIIDPLAGALGAGSTAFQIRFENAGSPLTGATTYHLVRVSSSVLITADSGETANTPAGLAGAADRAAAGAADVLAAITGQDPGPTADGLASSTVSTEIPSDLPLDAGLGTTDGDTEVTPPSADGAGLTELDLCNVTVWPDADDRVDRLVTTASGPEYLEVRELRVYTDAGDAGGVMEGLREAASGCTADGTREWVTIGVETGYDSVTLGESYTKGLGAATYQWTRVGAAVLLVHRAGEGTREGLPADADRATDLSRQLAPHMCPFTVAGC